MYGQERGSLSAKEAAASFGHILDVLTALLKTVTLNSQQETLKDAQFSTAQIIRIQ